ncbi:Butyrophilin-like protein 2 [Channa argus]|uniref:Butyrophilin-like protein 2 n=1 Tax=Channa argus TaxID=215402 RepID=A0A6G1PJQ4_CHAAH|nr:Butyrophilin-like protein 2 [Channa argus]
MLMINAEMSSPSMELVPLLCLCLLTRSGSVFADGNGSDGPLIVREGDDAILPCSLSTKENIVKKLFDWKKDGQKEVFMYDSGDHYNNGRAGQDDQFKGRVLHFPEQLDFGNASITIRNTKVIDSGNYTCDFPRLQPRQIFNIKLVVGAAPEPSVVTLDETKDWSLLQCVVRGASPKPKVEWKDGAGTILPAKEPQFIQRGHLYDVILQTTVTKGGYYRCVATQEEIRHKKYTETFVHLNGRNNMD